MALPQFNNDLPVMISVNRSVFLAIPFLRIKISINLSSWALEHTSGSGA